MQEAKLNKTPSSERSGHYDGDKSDKGDQSILKGINSNHSTISKSLSPSLNKLKLEKVIFLLKF